MEQFRRMIAIAHALSVSFWFDTIKQELKQSNGKGKKAFDAQYVNLIALTTCLKLVNYY